MTLPKLNTSDISELDTKQRIIESALHLFAVKGFDGASIREIAKLANVNVASVNYHFQSKDNLRQEILHAVVSEFKKSISDLPTTDTVAEFAVSMYKTLTADRAKCLNQFKLIIESSTHPCPEEPYPAGFEELLSILKKELHPSVPVHERLWLVSAIFSYIVHIAVISSTKMGEESFKKIFTGIETSNELHIQMLAQSLIRDLNSRFK